VEQRNIRLVAVGDDLLAGVGDPRGLSHGFPGDVDPAVRLPHLGLARGAPRPGDVRRRPLRGAAAGDDGADLGHVAAGVHGEGRRCSPGRLRLAIVELHLVGDGPAVRVHGGPRGGDRSGGVTGA